MPRSGYTENSASPPYYHQCHGSLPALINSTRRGSRPCAATLYGGGRPRLSTGGPYDAGATRSSLALVIDVLLHRRAVFQVLRNDPVEQFRSDFSVPYIVGVHHDYGAARADEKAIPSRLSDGIGPLVEPVVLESAGH